MMRIQVIEHLSEMNIWNYVYKFHRKTRLVDTEHYNLPTLNNFVLEILE